jgi:hypothetical protein
VGKAARNEARKLRATRANNLSVGLFIAGFFIPYVAFTAKTLERQSLFDMGTADDWKQAAVAVVPAIVAWTVSVRLRRSAFKALEEIED